MSNINTIDAIKYVEKKVGICISYQTIINWINKYKIGKKIAGRYIIDQKKLDKLLDGARNINDI